MRTYIKKLRSKSEDTRKQILVVSLVVAMVFVGSVWVYSLGGRFNSQTSDQARTDIKPFTLFKNSLTSTYQNISASVGSISFSKKAQAPQPAEKQVDVVPVYNSTNQ